MVVFLVIGILWIGWLIGNRGGGYFMVFEGFVLLLYYWLEIVW